MAKNNDDGASFVAVNNGLDDVTIAAMAMDPKNPEVVYASAAFSMYKTVDGGASWFPIAGSGVSLIIDPSNPNTLYAGLSPSGGVVKSVDGGETFLPASNGMGTPAVFTLAIDPNHPNVVYAGTQGLGAFKSNDGAQTWTPLNIDSTVWSLLIDPTDSNIVYAGTDGHGIYKSVDAGNSFERVAPEVGLMFELAKSGGQLFAGTATQGVSVSDDGGRHWKNTGVTPNTVLIIERRPSRRGLCRYQLRRRVRTSRRSSRSPTQARMAPAGVAATATLRLPERSRHCGRSGRSRTRLPAVSTTAGCS